MTTTDSDSGLSVHDRLMLVADRLAETGERPAPPCPDVVNLPMIRNWAQAIGEADPVFLDPRTPGGPYAPPAMIQVWSMPGLVEDKGGGAADEVLRLLDESGFTGVVATNCEQTYDRYLRHGEGLRSTTRFGGVTGPKRTALGEGYFVTWHQTWYAQDDGRVAEMLFRVLKFRPPAPQDAPAPTRETASAPADGSGGGSGRHPLRPATGDAVEPLVIPLTPTFVISSALATRDFTPVHHDPALARAQGSADIFLNILTTMGLVQRCARLMRPGALLRAIAVRLGVPAYAGDTLTLSGRAVDERTLEIRGAVSLGDHVVATVRLDEDR